MLHYSVLSSVSIWCLFFFLWQDFTKLAAGFHAFISSTSLGLCFFDEVASSPVTNVTSRSNRRLWSAVVGGLEFELDPNIVIVECTVLSLTRFCWAHRCLEFSEFYMSSRICCSLSSISQIPEKKLWIPRMVQQKKILFIIIYSSKPNLSLFFSFKEHKKIYFED